MVRVGKFALSATVAAQLLLRMDVTLMLGVPRTWSAAFQVHPTIYWQSPQDMYHHNHYHYIGTITASIQIKFHQCSARCYIRCREKITNAERSKRPYPPIAPKKWNPSPPPCHHAMPNHYLHYLAAVWYHS